MTKHGSSLDHTPVLVGTGTSSRREEDHRQALEPLDLMLEAVVSAGRDAGLSTTDLSHVGYIAVPKGRWRYRNPAGEIARAIGAKSAKTVLASVGVLQQTLIAEACEAISRGDIDMALVVGADAGYRLLRAQLAGTSISERDQTDAPDLFLSPTEELRHPAELRAGMKMPVGLYAILESALRSAQTLSLDAHRARLAELYSQFSNVAAGNPHAWQRAALAPLQIRDASRSNPMQAFPYTRSHCSTWNVDQAAALLFCSRAYAKALRLQESGWIYPVASTESNHMIPVSARANLAQCVGAEVAGHAALAAAGLAIGQVDLFDLYSCFPVAVQQVAAALGLPLSGDLTVTGGMPFAGGPYNNYVLQATCRVAELIRAGHGDTALVSCVSGVMTKQAFGLWSKRAGPTGFVRVDVSDTVAKRSVTMEVDPDYSGRGVVAGYTVLFGREQKPRAVALLNVPGGKRALCTSEDESTVAQLQREEFVGRSVIVDRNTFTTESRS